MNIKVSIHVTLKNDAQTVWKRLGEPRASALNQLGMELTHPMVEANKLSPSQADQQDEQTTTSKPNEPQAMIVKEQLGLASQG